MVHRNRTGGLKNEKILCSKKYYVHRFLHQENVIGVLMEGAFSSKDEALAFIKNKAEVARGAFIEKYGFCGDFNEKNLNLPCSYIPKTIICGKLPNSTKMIKKQGLSLLLTKKIFN